MTLDNSTVVTCAWDGTLITMGTSESASDFMNQLVYQSRLNKRNPDINSGEFKKKNLWAKLGQLQILPNGIIAVADVMSVLSFLDMTTLDILRAYEVHSSLVAHMRNIQRPQYYFFHAGRCSRYRQ